MSKVGNNPWFRVLCGERGTSEENAWCAKQDIVRRGPGKIKKKTIDAATGLSENRGQNDRQGHWTTADQGQQENEEGGQHERENGSLPQTENSRMEGESVRTPQQGLDILQKRRDMAGKGVR